MYAWTSIRAKNNLKNALISSKDKIVLAFCCLLLIIGIFLGTIAAINISGNYLKYITIIIDNYFSQQIAQNFLLNFLSGFFSNFIYIFLLFLCGFCAISQPLIILLALFRGLSIGITISSIYIIYGKSAITFVFVLVIPSIIINSMLFIYCCIQSIKLSSYFYVSAVKNNVTKKQYLIKEFCLKYIAYTILVCLFSAINSIIISLFKNYFLI